MDPLASQSILSKKILSEDISPDHPIQSIYLLCYYVENYKIQSWDISPDHSNPIPFSQLVQVELAILSPEIKTDVWK